MKKRYKLALATASIALGFGVIQAKPAQAATFSGPINIYAAASLTETLVQVEDLYKKSNPNVTFMNNFGGSIGLANQIIMGTNLMGTNPKPVDIFFSVSQAPLDSLQLANQLIQGTRQDILNNTLAIITPINSTLRISSVQDLLLLNKVAIGNPASVPAGVFAQQLFANSGISGKLNLVLGTDVRNVLSLVSNNTVDAGIVYTTDAKTLPGKVKIAYTPPINTYSPIVYGSAVLRQTQNPNAAKDFNSFLRSSQALSVFQVSGFTPIPEPMTTGGSIAVGIVGLMMKRKVATKAKAKAAVD
ncbi:molybdate ABC transporter substrate-binding protein [Nostoc sp.]|uniref:molybdate ABC transporter substrate-binding protein n=1 Tax=Nostoc sp. TaxID=1180 RepID=UPI002FF72D2F